MQWTLDPRSSPCAKRDVRRDHGERSPRWWYRPKRNHSTSVKNTAHASAPVRYLEAHECHLTRGDVFPIVGDGHTRNVVIVSKEKFLLSCLQILDDQIASQWIDHVNTIWMQFETMRNFAWRKRRIDQRHEFPFATRSIYLHNQWWIQVPVFARNRAVPVEYWRSSLWTSV